MSEPAVAFSQIPHHRSFAVVQSAIAAAGPAVAGPRIPQVVPGGQAGGLPAVAVPGLGIRCDLLELLAQVSDGRPGQGRDHPVAVVLALAAAAVVAGMRRSPRSPGGPLTCL